MMFLIVVVLLIGFFTLWNKYGDGLGDEKVPASVSRYVIHSMEDRADQYDREGKHTEAEQVRQDCLDRFGIDLWKIKRERENG